MRTRGLFSLIMILALGGIIPLGVLAAANQKRAPDGQAIYKKNCNICHYPDKADKKLGPGLKGLFKNKELPDSHKPVSEAAIREQVEKGSKTMPGFDDKLSAQEMDSLMEYLKTL